MRTKTLLPAVSFERLFKTGHGPRDKFLSRLFGIFGEEIVRVWSRCRQAPYEDIGRPTVKRPGESRGKTLDFTFKSRTDGRLFVGEMKCELEFENYRYLRLTDHWQLDHHRTDAFLRFRDLARNPEAYSVTVNGKHVSPAGAILVWGSVTSEGRSDVKQATDVADVLSVEDMIGDLLVWNSVEYKTFIQARGQWCGDLFGILAGRGQPIREVPS
ncbi:MAG: hypothetical protein WBF66_03750 [Dehalococcoidia bacterium]